MQQAHVLIQHCPGSGLRAFEAVHDMSDDTWIGHQTEWDLYFAELQGLDMHDLTLRRALGVTDCCMIGSFNSFD